MLRSLVYSVIFATSLAYRVFEYTGDRCTGSQVGLHRLAGPSACTPLNEGVATSVLVKIDNVNDDKYTTVIYDTEDCTGAIVGSLTNFNGCLDLYAFHNTVGKAVQVIPASGKRDDPNKGFVTDQQYNLASKNETVMKVPIMHGGFYTSQKANHSEDGTYLDEAFDVFNPMTPEQLKEADEAEPYELASTDSTNYISMHSLSERQFEYAYCDWHAICMGAVDLGIKLYNVQLGRAINHYVNSEPWRTFWRGIDFVVGRAVNSIMIITSLQTSGTQNTACDTNKMTGRLIQDLVNSISAEGLMNASFMVKDENGKQFEVGIRVYTDKHDNTNSCGECALCQ